MSRSQKSLFAAGTACAALAAGAAWAMSPMLPSSPLEAHGTAHVINARPAAWQGGTSIADIVEQVEPAVVAITVDQAPQPVDLQGGGEDQGPFGDFLRQFMGQGGQGGGESGSPFHQAPQEHGQALGSGFLVDGSGDILTNNHVVDGGTRYTVEFADKSIAQATLVGTDPATDLALIHVDKMPSVTPLGFANSDALRVGDPVIAIGDPYGVGQTVTSGVISARGRSLGNSSYVDYLQTDAPINQGNSGGPLLDYSGHVVGINSAIFSPSGGNVGIGFAVPSNTAREIVAQLKAKGSVSRAWLGAAIQDVTPQIAAAAGLDKAEGAIIAQVDGRGPAAGKLRPGDIVLDFDGKPIREARDLSMAASQAPIGRDAQLTIIRQGSRQDIGVRMARLQQPGAQTLASSGSGSSETAPRLGVTVSSLDGDARRQLGLDDKAHGALITDADPAGAAARAGLQPGDVIEQVGNTPIVDGPSLAKALEQTRNETALLLVERSGQQRFLAVPLG